MRAFRVRVLAVAALSACVGCADAPESEGGAPEREGDMGGVDRNNGPQDSPDGDLPKPEDGDDLDDDLGAGDDDQGGADAEVPDLEAPDAEEPDVEDPDMEEPGDTCAPGGSTIYAAVGGRAGASGSSQDPMSLGAAVAAAEPGDTVLVRAGRYAEPIIPPRDGAPGAPIVIRGDCAAKPVLDGAELGSGDGLPAMIKLVDRAYVTVEGFEVRGVRARSSSDFPSGVWVRGASHHVTLRDNLIHDIRAWRGGQESGAHGLAVYGTRTSPAYEIVLEGNELHSLVLGWSEALVINGNVRGFVVEGNQVHDVNNIAFDFIGFEADVCPGCTREDVIDQDNVNRVRDGLIRGNQAWNASSAGNPAYGDDKSAGCFYVDGGARLVLEGNIAHHCDIGVELASEWPGRSTREIIVRSNLLYAHDVTGIATGGYSADNGPGGGSARDCAILNNTLVDPSRDGWAEAAMLLQNRNVNNRYQNNVIVATSGHAAIADFGERNQGLTFSHNLVRGGLDGVSGGSGHMTGDPQFVDAAGGDYRLRAGSPGRESGTSPGAGLLGERDLEGEARVQGVVDRGAYED